MRRACLILVIAAALTACQTVQADNPPNPAASSVERNIAIRGVLERSWDSTRGDDRVDISLTINGLPTELDEGGQFSAQVPLAPYYQVVARGPSIFTAIQTFGVTELYRDDCDCLDVPAIDLVSRKPGRVSLFFAGDVMSGRRFVEPIWGERQLIDPENPMPDLRRLLEPMRPYIASADLSSANLEIVLSEQAFENSPPKSVVFYAHPDLAASLKEAGFDHVSLGNNHSYDYLEEGLEATIAAVEEAGLAWSGAGHDEKQALAASRMSALDQDICLLGYVGWKGRVEPNQVAEADKGGAAHGTDANIAASVTREAATGCAVVAQYHGSREYTEEPTEVSERRMKLAVDSGAALIASHHPHVAQGLELYDDALIAYSLGNYLFDQYFLETHGSFALRVWLDDGRFSRAEIIPLRVLEYRPVPAVGAMREAVLDRVEQLSRRRGTMVERDGGHGVILAGGHVIAGSEGSMDWTDQNLLRGGDFENAVYGEAVDRSLKITGGMGTIEFAGLEGHHLRLTPGADSREYSLTPSTFLRVFPGKRIVVSGTIRTSEPLELALNLQRRPRGTSRLTALIEAPQIEVARASYEPTGGRVEFTLEFDLPDDELPFRPVLRIAGGKGAALPAISLDDLAISSLLVVQGDANAPLQD